MEIAVNAAIRHHPLSIALVSSTNEKNLKHNYDLKRRKIDGEVEKTFQEFEKQGPAIRYSIGVRALDKIIYDLQ